ncbi:hypothetical protein RchiOBHm_Chr5g0052421 [Rosa chinensis]|uniref:Uncharacterized protein n=1 Tax=Rosa chinensis TaxID=74649 RepID=A0A2P6QFM3_ROSCH|nr:hypothetical protein RchiOBHm_Chr5g0052421 [Rosa chinensis]
MAGKTDSVSYCNLKDTKVEMMGMDAEPHHRIDLNSSRLSPSQSSSSFARVPNGNYDLRPPQSLPVPNQNTLLTLILSCTVAAGVQFGWALRLSLLTPYI